MASTPRPRSRSSAWTDTGRSTRGSGGSSTRSPSTTTPAGWTPKTLRDALQFGNGTRLDAGQAERHRQVRHGPAERLHLSVQQAGGLELAGRRVLPHLSSTWSRSRRASLKEVPQPEPSKIPDRWRDIIRDPIGDHGTLVVWSQLDRVTWKGSKALLENSEFLVGRIYRYFIDGGKARIRLAAFEETEGGAGKALRPGRPRRTTRCT